MNRRNCAHQRPIPRSEPYLKYLKPGALAQLRDSRISARSRRISLHRAPLPPTPPANGEPHADVFPCFARRTFGPRCPQRKKLVASKPFLFLELRSDGSENVSPDSVLDALGGDAVAAN